MGYNDISCDAPIYLITNQTKALKIRPCSNVKTCVPPKHLYFHNDKIND